MGGSLLEPAVGAVGSTGSPPGLGPGSCDRGLGVVGPGLLVSDRVAGGTPVDVGTSKLCSLFVPAGDTELLGARNAWTP